MWIPNWLKEKSRSCKRPLFPCQMEPNDIGVKLGVAGTFGLLWLLFWLTKLTDFLRPDGPRVQCVGPVQMSIYPHWSWDVKSQDTFPGISESHGRWSLLHQEANRSWMTTEYINSLYAGRYDSDLKNAISKHILGVNDTATFISNSCGIALRWKNTLDNTEIHMASLGHNELTALTDTHV